MADELQELKKKKQEIDKKIKELKLKEMKVKTERTSVNRLIRVSSKFNSEISNIIDKRLELKKDKSRISKPAVTDLVVKHNLWGKIKLDILNFIFDKKQMNKKGQMTIFILIAIAALFFISIVLLVAGITTVKINDALNQNITMGQVNLADINAQTFGIAATTYLNNADWWGIAAIFGMVIGLFLSSYLMRNKFPKLGIIFDVFIIIAVFIFSMYLSSTYKILLDSLASVGESFLEVYTPKTSMFILNLPIFSTIIGVIMMILFHSSIPNKPEERALSGGFLRGV